MNAEQLLEEIGRRARKSPNAAAFRVFWLTLAEDRNGFSDEVRRMRADQPIVPTILRASGLFRDPNSVMNDVAVLLDYAREEIIAIKESAIRNGRFDLVILSRSELALAMTSSPLELPDWFPIRPGHTVTADIDDLTWSVHVSLSDRSVGLNDLRRILYELDVAMLSRIRMTQVIDPRRVHPLWDRIRRTDDDDIAQTLQGIEETLRHVKNPYEFRPSTSRNPSLIGRLWFEASKSSADRLPRTAKALGIALHLGESSVFSDQPSLTAVLSRPTAPIPDGRTRWAFYLMITLRNACQLVTAAAHADEYPMFPDALLRTTSLDIRRFLDEAVQVLKS